MANTHSPDDAIRWMREEGIARGWAPRDFRVFAMVSRQAMAAFFYRLAHDGADAPACTERPFPDVGVSNQFCGEIAWLEEQGITRGYDDGTYRPTASMSRASAAAFLYRLFTEDNTPPPCEVATTPFRDVGTGHPFCGEVWWMYDEGISDGYYQDLTYRPTWPVSRRAMAAFLYRAIEEEGMTVA